MNVATVNGKEEEIVEIMKERSLDLIGFCETRLKREGRRVLHEDNNLIYKGSEDGRHGVAYVLSPELARRVDNILYKS